MWLLFVSNYLLLFAKKVYFIRIVDNFLVRYLAQMYCGGQENGLKFMYLCTCICCVSMCVSLCVCLHKECMQVPCKNLFK